MNTETLKEEPGRFIENVKIGKTFRDVASVTYESDRGRKMCDYIVTEVHSHFCYVWNNTLNRRETRNLGDLVVLGLEPSDPYGEAREGMHKAYGPSLSSKLAYGKLGGKNESLYFG